MPIYTFERNCDGAEVDRYYPVDSAPRIGDEVVIDGQVCTRLASFLLDGEGIARKTHQYPFCSESLPKWTPNCEHDGRGRPIIRSQAHERDILAQEGYVRD